MASVEKRTRSGQVRWLARWRDDTGTQRTKSFDRKSEADRYLASVTVSLASGTYIDPRAGQITFAAFYAEWARRQVWESGTVRAMNLAAGSVPFAQLPMRSIRRSHVESWIKAMQTADRGKDKDGKARAPGLAPGTITTRLNNVRGVFRAAVTDRVIATDPTDGVTLPRRRRAEAAMVLPTPDQVRGVLAVEDTGHRARFALCAFAGLRLGEAAALQVGDVDFLGRTIHVVRQVQRETRGGVEIKLPKYGSERRVYAADGLLTILSAHIAAARLSGDPGAWLFSGGDGQPVHQNTVGHWWRMARRETAPGVRLHDLRHYFASGLIAAGCDVVTVQRALGHSSASVTLSTYAHLWPDAEDRTRKAAQAMIDTALGATGWHEGGALAHAEDV
jgi:integrase